MSAAPDTVAIIRKTRDGHELSREEIAHIVHAYTNGEIPDHQAAAWLMASYMRGLTRAETAHLTEAMLHSGHRFDLSSFAAGKVGKHSTGGVGDKTSLILAPLVAAGGLIVPMISGRGLGHTGGTLDKLEAIPGFRVQLSAEEFHHVLAECGCAIIGQTPEIAPADRKLYNLRNFTGTIESPSLICASIMSKKLAEGIDSLVLDVKTGSGAFMKRREEAEQLTELMVETAKRMNVRAVALITDMDQPLGTHVGNALEVEEAIAVLHDEGAPDLRELSLELAAWMLHLGGAAESYEQAKRRAVELLRSGKALERFRQMIALQGGDASVVDDPKRLPQEQHRAFLESADAGILTAIHCERVGHAAIALGGGRERPEDAIDHAVGFVLHKKIGDTVAKGERLCTICYNSEARMARARQLLERSYTISEDGNTAVRPLVHNVIRDR